MQSSDVRALILVTIILAAALLAGCGGRTAAGAPAAGVALDLPHVTCEVCYDVSGSPDDEQFAAAKEQSKKGLGDFLQAFSCTALRAYTFADGFVPSEEWVVTPVHTTQDTSASLDPSLDHLKEADKLKQQRHRDTTFQIDRQLASAREGIVNAARGWIDANVIAHPAVCTAIRPFVQMTQERRLNRAAATVIYTDGDDTGTGCTSATAPLQLRHPVIFVVLPQKVAPELQAPSSAAAAVRLEKLYPGAVAIPYFELTDSRLWVLLRDRFRGGSK